MRRLDKQITDPDLINTILEKSDICRLGLVENNEAYIVPVNFAWSEGIIYIHTAQQGRKMNIIRANNRVSFEMELHHEIVESEITCGWTAKYRSVMGKGTITIDDNPTSKKRGLDLIMRKYGATMELNYDEKVLSRMTILKLEIESVTGKQSGEW
ncbi:MAG: pyridoxamine 5'-phosphate oxidase family protein [Paludibacter sp.]|nr:pyridoxamine 5'-phosphate oxidase family protein [Paludibacter sp.]